MNSNRIKKTSKFEQVQRNVEADPCGRVGGRKDQGLLEGGGFGRNGEGGA